MIWRVERPQWILNVGTELLCSTMEFLKYIPDADHHLPPNERSQHSSVAQRSSCCPLITGATSGTEGLNQEVPNSILICCRKDVENFIESLVGGRRDVKDTSPNLWSSGRRNKMR